MKSMKKLASLMLAAILALAIAMPVMADIPTTGSITINASTDESVNVQGKTFQVYRILDAKMADAALANDGRGIAYTIPGGMQSFFEEKWPAADKLENQTYDAYVASKIAEMSTDSTELEDFAKDALEAAKAANEKEKDSVYCSGQVTATGESLTFSDLPLGYYIIEDVTAGSTEKPTVPVSALMLDSTVPDATVKIKASQPAVDKKVKRPAEGSVSEGWYATNNAPIGGEVEYQLTSKVPDMRGYKDYQFVMTDRMTKGLDYKDGSLTVKIGTQEITPTEYEKGTEGTPSTELPDNVKVAVIKSKNDAGDTVLEIVFGDFYTNYKDKAGDSIEVTYKATVNEDAVIGVEGNSNYVKLSYSHKPGESSENEPDIPSNPIGETPEREVRTYVTGIELFKIDDTTKAPLAGAKFTVTSEAINKVIVYEETFTESTGEDAKYWKLKDGTYTLTAPSEDTSDKYESTTIKYKKDKTKKENVMSSESPKTVTMTTDASGVLSLEGLKAGTYTITETEAPSGYNKLANPITINIGWTGNDTGEEWNCVWNITKDGEKVPESNNGRVVIAVPNNTGTELPSTGGIGTTIFYVIGGILVIGAGILLVTKRRMKAQ